MDTSPFSPSQTSSNELNNQLQHDSSHKGIQNRSEDLQNVKLFLGQLPNTMEEDQLKQMFSPFGEITGIKILKDRITGMHKGCAFLTFRSKESCDAAIAALHNKKTFPPAKNPIQVKYAEGQLARFENKLFVGQIPKEKTEEDIKNLFSPYGDIEQVNLLRDSSGISKGCCFVKYKTRESASKAILGLVNYTFEGESTSPLVVKWADTQQQRNERNQRKIVKAMNTPLMYPPSMTTYYPPPPGMVQLPYGYFSPYYNFMGGTAYQIPMPPMTNAPTEGVNMLVPQYTEEEFQNLFPHLGGVFPQVISENGMFGYISYEEGFVPEGTQNVITEINEYVPIQTPTEGQNLHLSFQGDKSGYRE